MPVVARCGHKLAYVEGPGFLPLRDHGRPQAKTLPRFWKLGLPGGNGESRPWDPKNPRTETWFPYKVVMY